MAIVRFRIDNDRWPDMNNPSDVARVDALDSGPDTVRTSGEKRKSPASPTSICSTHDSRYDSPKHRALFTNHTKRETTPCLVSP